MLPKIGKNQSLSQQAYSAIKKAILSNELKPKELLREEALASTLGISRTPLRAALKQLQFEKLIVVNSSKHAFVSEVKPEIMTKVFVYRFAVEPIAARAAASTIEREDIGRIEDCLARHEEHIREGKLDKIIACELEFSRLIAESTRNEFLIDGTEMVNTYMQRFIAMSKTVTADVTESVGEHRGILEALDKGDGTLAEERTVRHLYNVAGRARFKLPF